MEGLGITIFNQVGGSLRGLVGTATEVAGKINEKLSEGKGIEKFIRNAKKYWGVFKTDVLEVGKAFGDTISSIAGEVIKLTGAFGSDESVKSFSATMGMAADALKSFAGFLKEHDKAIAKVLVALPKLVAAYEGFKIVKAVAPFVGMFTGAIGGLAKMGLSKLAPNLFGVAKGQDAIGKSSGASSKKMLASAKSFMMMGVGVLMVSTGMYLLAKSAVSLAGAGPLAIGVMVGMVAAVGALGYGMVTAINSMKGSAGKLQSIAAVFVAFGVSILLISTGFWILSDAAIRLASAGPAAIATMAGMVIAIGGLLIVAKTVAPALTAGAAGFVAFGAAIVLAGIGMTIMTNAAINLANAGPLAIGVMAGLVLAIAGLALGAAALGPALTAGSIGFIAFGAAIALIGVGALLAATALTMVAAVLPVIVSYGASGAIAIVQLALGMTAFAVGATVAGAGCLVLGAGLTIVAVGLGLVGAAVLITAAGVMVLVAGTVALGAGLMLVGSAVMLLAVSLPMVAVGAMGSAVAFVAMLAVSVGLSATLLLLAASLVTLGVSSAAASIAIGVFALAMIAGCAGVLAMALALKSVNSNMKSIAKNAKTAQESITNMKSSVSIINDGLNALGSKAKASVNSLISSFSGGAGRAKAAGKQVGDGVHSGVKSGLDKLPQAAMNSMDRFNVGLSTGGVMAIATSTSMSRSIVASMKSASSGAYSSGCYIGQGLANGMRSQLGAVRSVAAQLAAAADAAIRAKAKIHSPSRVSEEDGAYWGEGWIGGILSKVKDAKRAAQKLIMTPTLESANIPDFAFAGSYGNMQLNEEYNYNRNATYTIVVPLEADGRQIAKATAVYTQEELDKLEKRSNRKRGHR